MASTDPLDRHSIDLTPEELPAIRVWEEDTEGWWRVGDLPGCEQLQFSPADMDLGSWSMQTHEQAPGAELFAEGVSDVLGTTGEPESRLAVISFRGWPTTWTIVPNPKSDDETKEPLLTVTGVSAFERLSREEAWPDPTKDINSQPVILDTDPAPYKGPAETVIKQLVSQNLSRVVDIVVPPSQGLGDVVAFRPQFQKLSDVIPQLARTGGVTVTIDLVPRNGSNSTRADLVLNVRVPEDLTKDVRLTTSAKTIDSYNFEQTPPTLTKARVNGAGSGGVDRIRQEVTTPASEAAAAKWGGHWTGSVDGPASFDRDELTQAGKEALLEGAATYALNMTAADTEGQKAFRDYPPGAIVTAAFGKAELQDTVSIIEVNLDPQEGLTVKPTLGDPSLLDPDLDIAATVGLIQQSVRVQQRK